jgi:hypothetical protein
MAKKKASRGGEAKTSDEGDNGSGAQGQAQGAIDIARSYLTRTPPWHPIPVPYMQKKPDIKGWPKLNITLENVGKYFNSGRMNVGVQLGPKSSGLTDADLDCDEALVFASYFMPPTTAVFGRASNPRSHWLYYCDDPPEQAVIVFDDDQGKKILELRVGGGSKGAQTVFPGSTHTSGEAIAWDEAGEPPHASYGELHPGAVKVACATLLVRGWPGQGSRHTAALIVGGFLARVGWELEVIKEFISAVAKEAGDNEISNRVQAAEDSYENFARGDEHVYGFPKLQEMFGEDTAKLIAKWVDYRDDHSELLAELNEKFCVLPIGGKTRVVTWDKDPDFPGHETIAWSSSLADFRSLYDKYVVYTYHDERKGKDVTVRRGTWWVNNSERRQYDGGMRFMPNCDEPVVNNTLNLWRGFRVAARRPEGKSGAAGCKLFLDHGRKIICSGNEEHWDYLIKREAFIAQRRTRSEIAVALRTEEEGTGKGFWSRTLNYLYGPHAMELQKPEHVVGKFNPHLEKLLRMTADEALFVHNHLHRNTLFYMITDPRLSIEPKNINVYQADNHLNIDVISNAVHFIPASRTARRFMVPTVSAARANDNKYFAAIYAQLKNEGGYEALLHHLLHEVDITDFNVRAVPRTAALLEQIAYSRKGVDLLVEAACNEGCVPCCIYPGFSDCNDGYMRRGFDYFIEHHSDNELRHMGALTVKRRLANEWGCITGKASRKQEGGQRIHGVLWPSLAELRAKFATKYGQQQWLCPDVTDWQKPDAFM